MLIVVRMFYRKFPYVHDAIFHIVQVYLTIKSEKQTLLTTPLSPKSHVKANLTEYLLVIVFLLMQQRLWEEQEEKATLPGCTQCQRE